MNDWEIPKSEARLIEEIEYFERKAREMQNYKDPYGLRMHRMYRDLAGHRRRLLNGLAARTPKKASGGFAGTLRSERH